MRNRHRHWLFAILSLFLLVGAAPAQPEMPAPDAEEARAALIHGRLLRETARPATAPQLPASTTIPADVSGTIAFSSDRAGTADLYTQPADGSQAATLLEGGGALEATPVWSPDGTQVVFASDRDGDTEIFLRAEGGAVTQLTFNDVDDMHPSWSPAGDRLLFTSNRTGTFEIFTMDLDGSNVQPLTAVSGQNLVHPRWSPDGTQIAYMQASIISPVCSWNWDVWLLDVASGERSKFTDQLGADLYPRWSPDGTRIIYASCRLPYIASDLYVSTVANGVETRLTETSFDNEWSGEYAPDGDYIVYNSDAPGNEDIFIMPATGGPGANLTQNTAADLAPSWTDPTADAFSVSGRVVNSYGNPVEGIRIHGLPVANVLTDGDGRYFVPNVPAGSYVLTPASDDGAYPKFIPATHTITLPPAALSADFEARSCAGATEPALVFITGWSGSVGQNYMQDDSQLEFFARDPHVTGNHGHVGPGYVEGCNLFYVPDTTPTRDLARNGEIIAEELCRIRDRIASADEYVWNGAIDIIAHSYGGLRARAFLENSDLYDEIGGLNCGGYSLRVRNLFTMGTPHGGEYPTLPLSVIIGGHSLIRGNEWPAIREMLPHNRLPHNWTAQQPSAVCYRTIGGDAGIQVGEFSLPLRLIYQRWAPLPVLPNDLAVHQWSAFQLSLLDLLNENYPRTRIAETGDLHGEFTEMVDPLDVLKSYVNPSDTYDEHIAPWLNEPACDPTLRVDGVRTPATQFVTAQQTPRQTEAVPMRDLAMGEIDVGEVVTGTFEVQEPGQSQVALTWSRGELTLDVGDPTGTSLGGDPDVLTATLDSGYGMMSTVIFTTTVTGTYYYTATAGLLDAPATYRLIHLPPTPIAVQASAPSWVPFATPVVITATTTHAGGALLTGGTVTGTIVRPDESQESVTLFDDGQHQDGAAGDGVFGVEYAATSEGGAYSLQLISSGSYNSQPYERSAVTTFLVGTAGADLTDQYNDAPLDDDDDNFSESLVVTATLDVTTPGTYTLAAELHAGDTFIDLASTTVQLEAGQPQVTLHFSGHRIRAADIDGPYAIRNVSLLDETAGAVLITAADEVHQTGPYDAGRFGEPYRIFLPAVGRE